mgnify:FL=1
MRSVRRYLWLPERLNNFAVDGVVMKNPINNHVFRLAFVLILSGCASDPAPDYSNYPSAMTQPATA